MKIIVFVVLLISTAFADAEPPLLLTCRGEGVFLQQKSPYLGADSPYQQNLYVLSRSEDDPYNNTAFFLNVDQDGVGAATGGAGKFLFSGENSVGGSFSLTVGDYQRNNEDDTGVSYTTTGHITFQHGPLTGENVPVNCSAE